LTEHVAHFRELLAVKLGSRPDRRAILLVARSPARFIERAVDADENLRSHVARMFATPIGSIGWLKRRVA
jgi:hypothetical protein